MQSLHIVVLQCVFVYSGRTSVFALKSASCKVRVLSYCFGVIEKRGEGAVFCMCSVAVLGTVTRCTSGS